MNARQRLLRPTPTSPSKPAHLGNHSLLTYLHDDLAANPQINCAMPGRTFAYMQQLSPTDQLLLTSMVNQRRHQEDLGRHGDVRHVDNAFEMVPDVARRVTEGFDVEDVTSALMERNKPIPERELTRRDQIDAAFAAHEE